MVTGETDDSPWQDPPARPEVAQLADEPELEFPLVHCGFRWTDRTPGRFGWVCTRDPKHTGDHQAISQGGTVHASRAPRRKRSTS